MNATDWLVITGGVAVIVWVNWYFFLAQRASVATFAATGTASGTASTADGTSGTTERGRTAKATIVVKGGYEPAVIRVKAGEPVRLIFDRQETSGCSEEIVFPDFGIKKFLPAFQKTTVELTPPRPGKYGFTCGMSMLHGSLIAE